MTESICDIVLLAAGGSRRLGKPKQLLPFGDTNLFNYSLDVAKHSNARNVVVVYGGNESMGQTQAIGNKVVFIRNDGWQKGIASSIATGLQYVLQTAGQPDAVLFMVCDQPFITTDILNLLMEPKNLDGKEIAAAFYAGSFGTPALFPARYFPELLSLEGDEGARKIIKNYGEAVIPVPFPRGSFDIDTMEDYDLLNQYMSKQYPIARTKVTNV